MSKILLIDSDGVVIKPRQEFFSDRYARDFDIDPELIIDFLKNQYQKCIRGKADLKVELEKVMADWKWIWTVEELLDYWFSAENDLDPEVLKIISDMRSNGAYCYLTSDHTKYRKDNVMQTLGMDKHFDGAYFSCDLGFVKSEPGFF